jgi:signal transduction histidine kinase
LLIPQQIHQTYTELYLQIPKKEMLPFDLNDFKYLFYISNMKDKPRSTFFAPAERAAKQVILKEYEFFKKNALLTQILEAAPLAVLILNDYRQIIFANKAFLDVTGAVDLSVILGLRAGEAVGCLYSEIMEGGCGTSEYCRECGAVNAILSGIEGNADVQECSISRGNGQPALDLRVMASPLEIAEGKYTIFSILNIAHEKRKEVLERIFLHDVKNTAGGIQGFSRLLVKESENEIKSSKLIIKDLADKLVDEIDSYHQLAQAESSHLEINHGHFNTVHLLERIKNLYMNHEVAQDKSVQIDPNADPVDMLSDETILNRVLGNMTKNALEAIRPGSAVTLSCLREGEKIRFSVHNPGVIPTEIRTQIFQRFFSTKGTGRGLGTYSIKLLSEHYLQGQVGFTSSESEGTIFYGIFPMEIDSSEKEPPA